MAIKDLSTCLWFIRSGLRIQYCWPQRTVTSDSYNNAMAESINGFYKAKVIHRKTWKNRSELELAKINCYSRYGCY